MGPYGPIFVVRGEKSQVKKVKTNISDRDFFLGLFQGDCLSHPKIILKIMKFMKIIGKSKKYENHENQHIMISMIFHDVQDFPAFR